MLTGISYDSYFKGSEVLNDLLQPAVVALAYPLYQQLHQIRARWKSIHHHLFYRQRGCDGDGDFRGIVDGRFTGNRRVNPAEISHHAYCNGGWRQSGQYPGNQRSLP
ncbi:LrgB family protein [Escherichia coli]